MKINILINDTNILYYRGAGSAKKIIAPDKDNTDDADSTVEIHKKY
jgi:hypothetical protein